MNNIIDYKKIGLRIRTIRKEKNITQQKLCHDLNISLYHYSKIENAHVSVSLETLAEIAQYLDADLCYLLNGTSKVSKNYLDDEMSFIYKNCDSQQKKLIIEFAKIIAKSEIKSVPTK
ncbi:helix-turn-helix domain-containing protein [Massiliimalia timonensis]|uniref:helix-turn-helix domain-containing protein n=1 Tax=Massiliimalia timonensis TaxID=1987501 RepID=UPI00189DA332|nr:helix-turn-helix transcriptional regulator [Massiliimalia timonensis]